MSGGNTLTLPPGWTVAVGRETVQTNSQNQNVQGLNYTLANASLGVSTTVFLPYALQDNLTAVSQFFNQRIAAITGVVSLGGS